MGQRELERRIKNCLQIKRQFDSKTLNTVKSSLLKADDYLIKLQKIYLEDHQEEVARVNINKRGNHNVPSIYKQLIAQVSQLFSVTILPTKLLVGGHIEPINNFYIIAPKSEALLIAHYLDYLYLTLEGIVESLTARHKLSAKQYRRKTRRNTNKGLKPINTKTYSSDLRKRMIDDIVFWIKSCYDFRYSHHKGIVTKGKARKLDIENRLKEKYGKPWKRKLAT